MTKVNLNLVAIFAILAVISIPIVYAVVEPSIILNMDSGQTTKPLQIKDNLGNEVFSVDTDGTVFPAQGGEVFTWTADHDTASFDLINLSNLQFATRTSTPANSVAYIHKDIFDDIVSNVAPSKGHVWTINGVVEFEIQPSEIRLHDKRLEFGTGAGDTFIIETGGADDLLTTVGGQNAIRLQEIGTEVNTVFGALNFLAINSPDGFLYIPTTQGTPTGTPTAYTGKSAFLYDETNNKLYVRDVGEGIWKEFISGAGGTSTTMIGGNHFGALGGGSGDRFFFPSGQSDAVGNETEMIMVMTTSGTIDNLFVKYIEGGGNTLNVITTVTVRKNLADTSLTVNIPASSTALVSNTSSSFTFVAGDEISVKFGIPSGTGSGTKPHWSFDITS